MDSSVLLAVARGEEDVYQNALDVLDDPERIFVSSVYVELETLPNAVFHRRSERVLILRTFFDNVSEWVPSSPELSGRAFALACEYGLGAIDALHIAASESAGAELITAERPSKPMLRVASVNASSIRR